MSHGAGGRGKYPVSPKRNTGASMRIREVHLSLEDLRVLTYSLDRATDGMHAPDAELCTQLVQSLTVMYEGACDQAKEANAMIQPLDESKKVPYPSIKITCT